MRSKVRNNGVAETSPQARTSYEPGFGMRMLLS